MLRLIQYQRQNYDTKPNKTTIDQITKCSTNLQTLQIIHKNRMFPYFDNKIKKLHNIIIMMVIMIIIIMIIRKVII